MSPAEMARHARKKFCQFTDARRGRDWTSVKLDTSGAFPILPKPADAPETLRAALRRDTEEILAGRWRAFGHLEIKVDDPPLWHCDYLAGENLATTESAFQLNHRALPGGADVKLIWELSRWSQLVRLAQSASVLGDERAGRKCVAWLGDWVKHNPPYRGWNWTSALEVGMRLIQFTWIDALLHAQAETCDYAGELETLRYKILPAHAWFAWRHQSFGSSANNHLLGELTGLILATTRWPELARWGAPLEELQARWEREVLAQFAEDGGNKEQALNYQLFSFEFCWQARDALKAAGKKISFSVEKRLSHASLFFAAVQVKREPWDYGDSDNAFVSPLFLSEQTVGREWQDWIAVATDSAALPYWLGNSAVPPGKFSNGPPLMSRPMSNWEVYPDSGIAICESGFHFLRFDASPLGYLRTAAHGHLDALHLSIWCKGVALVIDPGTGAYYADTNLRAWLASRAAHNGPCPVGEEFPKRLGPFLWAQHHDQPRLTEAGWNVLLGELNLPGVQLRRTISTLPDHTGWQVEDEVWRGGSGKNSGAAFRPETKSFTVETPGDTAGTAAPPTGGESGFTVRWQFAPGACVKILGERKFAVNREDVLLGVEVSADWAEVKLVKGEGDRGGDAPLAGIVSPAFRKTCFAPYLLLTARPGDKPCVFRTTFLACVRA